jgi:hypothetical protein
MANRLHLESGGCFADEAYTGGVLDGLRIANRFDQCASGNSWVCAPPPHEADEV